MTEDTVDRIMWRLKNGYCSKHTPADEVKMRYDAAKDLAAGWSEDDIVRHMSYTEEVNPDMDEDRALAAMKKISDKYK